MAFAGGCGAALGVGADDGIAAPIVEWRRRWKLITLIRHFRVVEIFSSVTVHVLRSFGCVVLFTV